MHAIRATWKDGRIVPLDPIDWPDGTQLFIEPHISNEPPLGLREDQWRDDPQSIAEWNAWVDTIEPLEYTKDEIRAHEEFEAKMREFNIEAVRREMNRKDDG